MVIRLEACIRMRTLSMLVMSKALALTALHRHRVQGRTCYARSNEHQSLAGSHLSTSGTLGCPQANLFPTEHRLEDFSRVLENGIAKQRLELGWHKGSQACEVDHRIPDGGRRRSVARRRRQAQPAASPQFRH